MDKDLPGAIVPKKASTPSRTPARGPIVSRGHLDANLSQLRLEETFPGWLVTRWTQHDYGIDAMIEITDPIQGSIDRVNTGKKFSAQLKARSDARQKSGDLALSISVLHLRHWLNSTEWVMLVYYETPTGRLFFRWIDDALVSELTKKTPSWPAQENVTIRFSEQDALGARAMVAIADHASRRKQITRGHLAPGEFFELRDGLARCAERLVECAQTTASRPLIQRATDARAHLDKACYFVALAGPSRAGKSTLLNILAGAPVSPVNILPTTAVPMLVLPGTREEVEVLYLDGRREAFDLDVRRIEDYVSQARNQDNEKRVRMLNVRLVNPDLERGIAFLDIPGLDDPSPEIISVTETGLRMASAVIYVVDGSTMATGGFALRKADVDNLIRIGTAADRLFFVVNKTESLDTIQKNELLAYLAAQFKKYKIDKVLPIAPLLLSAKNAELARRENAADDSVHALELVIWDFLINKQKTGLDLLLATTATLDSLVHEIESITAAHIITIGEVKTIRAKIEIARERARTIQAQMESEKIRLRANSHSRLEYHKQAILEHLRRKLVETPQDEGLPTNADVKHYLEESAKRAFTQEAQALHSDLGEVAQLATRTATEILADVQKDLKASTRPLQLPGPSLALADLEAPPSFSWIMWGLAGGLLGAIAGPVEAGLLAIIAIFGNLFISAETLRARKIEHVMKTARTKYEAVFTRAEAVFATRADEGVEAIATDVRGRVLIFTAELMAELSKRKATVTNEDAEKAKTILAQLGAEREALRPLAVQLRRLVY